MAFTSTPETGTDPTMAELVPPRSPWRVAALAVLAVLVLVATGVVGVQAHIGLDDEGGAAQVDGAVIVSVSRVVARGWPGLEVTGVTPAGGTELLGAWVIPAGDPLVAGDPPLDGLLGRLDAQGARFHVPRAIVAGEPARIVVAVRLTDCSAPASWQSPRYAQPPYDDTWRGMPIVHLRTRLGTTLDVGLQAGAFPPETFTSTGACP